jgi:hypothetical protein
MCKKKYEFEFLVLKFGVELYFQQDLVVEEAEVPGTLGKQLVNFISFEKEIRWILWWRKPEYPVRTTGPGKTTDKLYHLRKRNTMEYVVYSHEKYTKYIQSNNIYTIR